MSSPASQRLSLKAKNDAATREAMTQRRQEWTSRIRKAKKDYLLAKKRRYFTPVTQMSIDNVNEAMIDNSDSSFSIIELANRATQNPSLHLEAFQRALSVAESPGTIPHQDTHPSHAQLKPEDVNEPLTLLNALAGILLDSTASEALKLTSARALTNLAAMEASREEDNYYGNVPQSWSTLLLQSNVLMVFHQLLTSQKNSSNDLILQSCWALGNLVADSSQAASASTFLLPDLVEMLTRGLKMKQPSLCRNVAWVISSLVRAGTTTDQVFCGPDLLTPSLLTQLLVSPEHERPQLNDSVSWLDVAQETAWILAFLTARDDAVVDYLCTGQPNVSESSPSSTAILEALACRLHHALQQTTQASTWSSDEATQALKMTIPCLRAVGNIASSSHGNHLPALLNAHSKSIVKSLAILLDLGCIPSSSSHIHLGTAAVEGAWAARTILCDAGLDDHVSTTIAFPELLQHLCKCVTSGYGKQELKREAMSALWTAASAPPRSDQTMGSIWSTRSTRDDFLRQIGHCPRMIATLVDLLKTSVDADMLFTTLQLVNAILRRLPDDVELRRDFEENDGVHALEHVCDLATTHSNYGGGTDWKAGDSPAADIAADLLDDLFSSTSHEDEMMEIAPSQDDTAFKFGFPQVNPLGSDSLLPARGRGRPVPSWMNGGS